MLEGTRIFVSGKEERERRAVKCRLDGRGVQTGHNLVRHSARACDNVL